jgi:hypothetical protein
MATTTITPHTSTSGDADHATARRALLPVAVITTAITVTLSILEAHSTAEWIVEVAIELVAALLLFALAVRLGLRKPSAGGRGIGFGVAAIVLVVPAFWSGLPLLLGAAGALLGLAGRRADKGAGTAIASLVLGTLAVAAYIAIYIVDWILNH